jgi:hypothetical protein
MNTTLHRISGDLSRPNDVAAYYPPPELSSLERAAHYNNFRLILNACYVYVYL